jgi:hypothetical protein
MLFLYVILEESCANYVYGVTIFIAVQCSEGNSTLLPLNKSGFISGDVTMCIIMLHCPVYIEVVSGVRLYA